MQQKHEHNLTRSLSSYSPSPDTVPPIRVSWPLRHRLISSEAIFDIKIQGEKSTSSLLPVMTSSARPLAVPKQEESQCQSPGIVLRFCEDERDTYDLETF